MRRVASGHPSRHCRSTSREVESLINRVATMPKIPSGIGWAVETGRMSEETTRPVCATCGRIPEDESVSRITWAHGVEKGRQVWTCDLCCREHLRSIEGKLDFTWW